MTPHEYHLKIKIACEKAKSGPGWNGRFLYWLDVFELILRPIDWKDPTKQNMDIQAPSPLEGEQVTWPPSIIGDKNEI
jgi:hypothetical protein